jgi:nitrogen fixation/metabolism regulation signal transduction histidine kinase
MVFDRFQTGLVLRVLLLALTLALQAWIVEHSRWYITMALLMVVILAQLVALLRAANRSTQEVARFLNAIEYDDHTASFSNVHGSPTMAALGQAMSAVMDQLRAGRAEREEQSQYFQRLIAHVPVPLISIDTPGPIRLLNMAARQLFDRGCLDRADLARYGADFAAGIKTLKPGESAILRMERAGGTGQLKAAATGLVLSGRRSILISLQNIESELTAHELAAWQSVIRVMAHEVTNSLTPITSLSGTARDLIAEHLAGVPQEDDTLKDACAALETVAQRSEGLLHFVRNHRRLLRRMEVQPEPMPAIRVFARLQRLLAAELATRGIELVLSVEPPSLDVTVDAELIDQALINLVRNAMDALADRQPARIELRAWRGPEGRAILAVADNGPGIERDLRDRVFVPFFTTRRQGSGVGLTLVRQIAAAHEASVAIEDAEQGGAQVVIRF